MSFILCRDAPYDCADGLVQHVAHKHVLHKLFQCHACCVQCNIHSACHSLRVTGGMFTAGRCEGNCMFVQVLLQHHYSNNTVAGNSISICTVS
jgi:hypothetical protein